MLDELRARFRTRFIETARERIHRSLSLLGDAGGATQLVTELHSLAGEASMLGLDKIAEIARSGEDAAREWQTGTARAQVTCARAVRTLSQRVEAFAAEPAEVAAAEPAVVRRTPSGKRVLIVDDSELAGEQLGETLGSVGFQTRTAIDQETAVRAVSEFEPALVVTDVHMPGVDLATLCTAMRSASRAPMIIMLVSGKADEELALLCREVGADGYASKQAGTGAIVNRLRLAIEESRA